MPARAIERIASAGEHSVDRPRADAKFVDQIEHSP
jgi:hypothetical protein